MDAQRFDGPSAVSPGEAGILPGGRARCVHKLRGRGQRNSDDCERWRYDSDGAADLAVARGAKRNRDGFSGRGGGRHVATSVENATGVASQAGRGDYYLVPFDLAFDLGAFA